MQKAQALVNQLQAMKDEAQSIAQKISELDQERHEHGLVAETLEKLDSDRKCYRCEPPPACCARPRARRRVRISRSDAGCAFPPALGPASCTWCGSPVACMSSVSPDGGGVGRAE